MFLSVDTVLSSIAVQFLSTLRARALMLALSDLTMSSLFSRSARRRKSVVMGWLTGLTLAESTSMSASGAATGANGCSPRASGAVTSVGGVTMHLSDESRIVGPGDRRQPSGLDSRSRMPPGSKQGPVLPAVPVVAVGPTSKVAKPQALCLIRCQFLEGPGRGQVLVSYREQCNKTLLEESSVRTCAGRALQ